MAKFMFDFVNSIRSRLFYKMLIIYSLHTLVPLIVVSTTFYYRTSQLIDKKATEDTQQELGEVEIQKLSSIFRFSILAGEKFVSLETEFAFAEKYLQIHQYRFGGWMHYTIVLPDMLRQCAVPKLALQPHRDRGERRRVYACDRNPKPSTACQIGS